MDTITPLVYKLEEVSEILNINKDILIKAINNKEIPGIKIGNDYIIPKKFIDSLYKEKIIEIVKEAEITSFFTNNCVFCGEKDMEIKILFKGRAVCATCATELVKVISPIGKATLRTPISWKIKQEAQKAEKCFYCGKKLGKNKTLDHIIPVSRGGDNSIKNLVACCEDCNYSKGALTLGEWKYTLEERLKYINSNTKKGKKEIERIKRIISVIESYSKQHGVIA